MKLRGLVVLSVATAVAGVAASDVRAEKIPPELRSAFEGRIHKGCYGVVVQPGVPTTSVYGVKGDQTNAYYSVDIKGGGWQTSEGWLDLNQVAVDALALGEVMEVVDVTFKDARIDLRMASLEAHKVTRGGSFVQSTKREPVSTNFKFFFPFTVRGPEDLPQVLAYVEPWLRVFPNESAARAFAAQVVAGGMPPSVGPRPSSAGPAAAGATVKKEIKPGMSMLEVIDILGKPQKEVSFESRTRWTYPDLTVIFVNGRVKEVQF